MKIIELECDSCEEQIENPEEMIRVQIDNIPEKVRISQHFHTECWEGVN